MSEPEVTPRRRIPGYVYLIAAILIALVLSVVIESCDTEKVEICDTTTGDCDFESTCRPLLFDIVRGLVN
jgi:hypothetical protein